MPTSQLRSITSQWCDTALRVSTTEYWSALYRNHANQHSLFFTTLFLRLQRVAASHVHLASRIKFRLKRNFLLMLCLLKTWIDGRRNVYLLFAITRVHSKLYLDFVVASLFVILTWNFDAGVCLCLWCTSLKMTAVHHTTMYNTQHLD